MEKTILSVSIDQQINYMEKPSFFTEWLRSGRKMEQMEQVEIPLASLNILFIMY